MALVRIYNPVTKHYEKPDKAHKAPTKPDIPSRVQILEDEVKWLKEQIYVY